MLGDERSFPLRDDQLESLVEKEERLWDARSWLRARKWANRVRRFEMGGRRNSPRDVSLKCIRMKLARGHKATISSGICTMTGHAVPINSAREGFVLMCSARLKES